MRILCPALLATLCLAACGGDDDLGAWPGKVTGVYTVAKLTENTTACDAEGASALADDRDHLIVFPGKDSFGPWVRALTCADPAACRALRATVERGAYTPPWFDRSFREDEGDHLSAIWISTGSTGGGAVCTDAQVARARLSQPAPMQLRLEDRATIVDAPKEKDGFCTTDAARSAASKKPCNRLRVVEATFAEAP